MSLLTRRAHIAEHDAELIDAAHDCMLMLDQSARVPRYHPRGLPHPQEFSPLGALGGPRNPHANGNRSDRIESFLHTRRRPKRR